MHAHANRLTHLQYRKQGGRSTDLLYTHVHNRQENTHTIWKPSKQFCHFGAQELTAPLSVVSGSLGFSVLFTRGDVCSGVVRAALGVKPAVVLSSRKASVEKHVLSSRRRRYICACGLNTTHVLSPASDESSTEMMRLIKLVQLSLQILI